MLRLPYSSIKTLLLNKGVLMKPIHCLFVLLALTFLPSFSMEQTGIKKISSEPNLYSLYGTQELNEFQSQEKIIVSQTENQVTTLSHITDREVTKLAKENCNLKEQLRLTKWCTLGICTTLLIANVLVLVWGQNSCTTTCTTNQPNNNQMTRFPYPYSNSPTQNNNDNSFFNFILSQIHNITTYK